MNRSAIIHKILNLNERLNQLNNNNSFLSKKIKNPALENFHTKIALKHAVLQKYFKNYSGMKLFKIHQDYTDEKRLTSKEQSLRHHERLLVEIKKEAKEIESNLEGFEKLKATFFKLNQLCCQQLVVIQKEIKMLFENNSTELNFDKNKPSIEFS